MTGQITAEAQGRLAGTGIATPFALWKWHNLVGPAAERCVFWKDVDIARQVQHFNDLPVFVVNDATAASSPIISQFLLNKNAGLSGV